MTYYCKITSVVSYPSPECSAVDIVAVSLNTRLLLCLLLAKSNWVCELLFEQRINFNLKSIWIERWWWWCQGIYVQGFIGRGEKGVWSVPRICYSHYCWLSKDVLNTVQLKKRWKRKTIWHSERRKFSLKIPFLTFLFPVQYHHPPVNYPPGDTHWWCWLGFSAPGRMDDGDNPVFIEMHSSSS